MRRAYSAARVAFWVLLAAVMATSSFAQQLSITNYVIRNSARVSVTQWQYVYQADILNTGGPALTSATATLSVTVPNIVLVPGKNVLNFGAVPANGQVTAKNTFTINVDRTVQFKLTDLHWTFQTNGGSVAPIANAGPNQTAAVGSTVTLDGTNSSNPSGIGTLGYSWIFTALPPSSSTTLTNPNSPTPTFFMDAPGTYVIQLTVSNGTATGSASTTVSTTTAPVANAGPNQSVALNALVTLDGSKSTDADGDPLTYAWTFTSIPTGSSAVLSGANTVAPTFTADKPGQYQVQLVVNDGSENSSPSTVTISQNSPPVADAGANQSNISVGSTVQLDGSKSTDVDGESLTYLWSLIARPTGSTAVLSGTNIVNPTFKADVAGTYTAQLIVNDGTFNSSASTVTITTGSIIQKPTANAGLPQKLIPGSTVSLDGSASSDPQNLPLTYAWTLTTKPTGSTAVLSSNLVKPTFVADLPGTYIAQLIVNNGTLASTPATVTIAIDTPPVANAGTNQSVLQGANVLLNGGGSFDADVDTLSYSWSFTSRPTGSTATLSGANTIAPTFVADVAGTFVVQLIVSDSLTTSNPPATVTITVTGLKVITLTPSPLTIGTTTGNGTLTVNLASPAGASGQVVTLASSNKSAATVPASVTIPVNGTSATVAVTPVAAGTTTITGTASGFTSGTATVNVVVPAATVTLDFPSVGVSGQITAHVTLNVPSPSTTSIGLSSNPTGIVTVPSSVPIAAGVSTAPFSITGVKVGTTTVRGVIPGYSSVGASVTVVTAPLINVPTSLTAQAGQPPVTMNISLQNPAPAAGVTVSLTSSVPAKATVTASVFIAAGATTPATQPTVTGLAPGTTSISVSATGYASASTNVTVTAGPPASITQGGTPQSVAINTAFTALTATVKDSLGNAVSGVSVTFTAPATAGAPGVTVASTSATTNAAGLATVTLTANATAGGPYTVTASVNGVTANYSLTNLSGPPKTITASSGGGQSSKILTAFLNPLKALVKDVGGNPIAGVLVTFSAPTTAGAPSGTFAGGGTSATATSDATGVATSPAFTANGTVSPSGTPYTVTVTVNSNTTLTASFSMTNLAGPPTQIAATAGSGQSIAISTAFVTTLQATVKDAGGNLASGVPVTFTAPSGSVASGTFTGGVATATVNTNTSGVATAPALTANTIAGAFTVTATFAGGPTASFSLTNNPGTPASITSAGAAAQSVQINTAFSTLQATVKDVGGNLVNGATVTFTAVPASNGASGKFGSSASATATTVNGVASAPTFTANLITGSFTVNATVTGASTPASFALTNTQGAPSTITGTAGSSTVQAGLAPATLPKVVVKDIGGNLLSNQTVTFTAPSSGASGTFAGAATSATAITDATGTAIMPAFTANFTLGAYSVTATINSLSTSFSLTNTPGVPAQIVATGGNPQSVAINANFVALVATVKDGGGNPVGAGAIVTFTAPASSGPSVTVTTTTATTNATGVATSPVLTANANKGGPYTVVASTGGATSANFTLTNLAGPPSSITATGGTPQATPNTTQFPALMTATVKDAGGDLLSGVVVTFTAPAGTTVPSGTFVGGSNVATATTDANGLATAPAFTANGKLGAFAVTASVSGLASTASFSLTNQSGPPAGAPGSLVGTPQSATVNVPFAAAMQATLKDAGGNLAAGYAVTFTAVPNANGASGTFAGGGTVAHTSSSASGVVQAPTFTANTTAGSYTVVMTVDVAPTVTASFALTNNAGTAAAITATAGTPQNVAVNSVLGAALQATVKDAFGNLVSGVSVTFTAPAGGASGKFGATASTSATTNASGVATTATAFTANSTTGTYNVTATSGSASSATFAITNTAGAAATITPAAASTPQTVFAGSAFSPLAAVVKDGFGNLVVGQPVVFTAPSGSGIPSGFFTGNVSTITVNTDATGTATAPFTANIFASTTAYNVTATINGLTATFVLTNKPGTAANMAPVAGTTPQSAQLTVAFTNAPAVKVTDANNNPVTGVTVTFTVVPAANGASGTFTGGGTTAQATTTATGVATAPAFTPNLILGTYSVTATTVNSLSSTFALTNTPGPAKTMTAVSGGGQSAQINAAFANVLVAKVTDVAGNLINGASVTFTAPSSGASLTFATGGSTATVTSNASGLATSPAITANGTVSLTTYTVTAAANGVSGVSTTFAMTNTPGPPASITVNTGTTPQSAQAGTAFTNKLAATVKDAGGNLINGATVTFTAVPASNGASALFGGPTTATVTTNSSGVATVPVTLANLTLGTYTVSATVQTTVPNVPAATFTLTNTVCSGCASIAVTNPLGGSLSVGQNLQTGATVTLSAPSNLSTLNVTISSSDPTKFLVSGRIGDPGVPSLTVPLASGAQTAGIYIQGVASSGTASLIASAPGYTFGLATVTLTPSGFVLVVNNLLGGNLVTNQGLSTPMMLQSYQLDSSMNPIGVQSVAAGYNATLTIENSNPNVGTPSLSSPFGVTGPTDTVNGVPLTFNADPNNLGTTMLTVDTPVGFSTPATGTTLIVTVNSSQMLISQSDATIGQNLQTSAQVLITGVEPNDTLVTITSSDPTKLLFSTTASGAGQSSIVVTITAGFSKSPSFFIQSRASSGSVSYTAQASGFTTLTKTAALAPSGIIIYGPGGLGNPSFTTTTLSTPSTITVQSEVLDSGFNPVSPQSVAGGLTVTSNISSSDSTVGTITVSPVALAGGTNTTTTQFQPNTSSTTGGTATISADVPAGFSTPAADQSVNVTVHQPGMSLSYSATVGKDLQVQGSIALGAPAPANGLTVTLTSNSSLLLVAANPTAAGTASVTVTIPGGLTNATFFLQALGSSGTVSFTASAPGFVNRNGSLTLGNSGVALSGPLGLGAPGANESVSGGADSTWAVYTALLDGSNHYVISQSLRAGLTVTASLSTSDSTKGTITPSVTITGGGAASVPVTFTPVAVGNVNAILAKPANLGLAVDIAPSQFYHTVPVTVKP